MLQNNPLHPVFKRSPPDLQIVVDPENYESKKELGLLENYYYIFQISVHANGDPGSQVCTHQTLQSALH